MTEDEIKSLSSKIGLALESKYSVGYRYYEFYIENHDILKQFLKNKIDLNNICYNLYLRCQIESEEKFVIDADFFDEEMIEVILPFIRSQKLKRISNNDS
jgi:hypothetical protein